MTSIFLEFREEIMIKRPNWTATWNDVMSVGIPDIDKDHKHFIFMINELNRSITDRKDPVEIRMHVQMIVDDAERHFGQEEKLFKKWQYPNSDEHAIKHAQVLKMLNAIMDNFVPYGYDSGWINIGLRIRDILIEHILADDMVYAEYYRNNVAISSDEIV
jgi:hemerythrin-like metal-binding protein